MQRLRWLFAIVLALSLTQMTVGTRAALADQLTAAVTAPSASADGSLSSNDANVAVDANADLSSDPSVQAPAVQAPAVDATAIDSGGVTVTVDGPVGNGDAGSGATNPPADVQADAAANVDATVNASDGVPAATVDGQADANAGPVAAGADACATLNAPGCGGDTGADSPSGPADVSTDAAGNVDVPVDVPATTVDGSGGGDANTLVVDGNGVADVCLTVNADPACAADGNGNGSGDSSGPAGGSGLGAVVDGAANAVAETPAGTVASDGNVCLTLNADGCAGGSGGNDGSVIGSGGAANGIDLGVNGAVNGVADGLSGTAGRVAGGAVQTPLGAVGSNDTVCVTLNAAGCDQPPGGNGTGSGSGDGSDLSGTIDGAVAGTVDSPLGQVVGGADACLTLNASACGGPGNGSGGTGGDGGAGGDNGAIEDLTGSPSATVAGLVGGTAATPLGTTQTNEAVCVTLNAPECGAGSGGGNGSSGDAGGGASSISGVVEGTVGGGLNTPLGPAGLAGTACLTLNVAACAGNGGGNGIVVIGEGNATAGSPAGDIASHTGLCIVLAASADGCAGGNGGGGGAGSGGGGGVIGASIGSAIDGVVNSPIGEVGGTGNLCLTINSPGCGTTNGGNGSSGSNGGGGGAGGGNNCLIGSLLCNGDGGGSGSGGGEGCTLGIACNGIDLCLTANLSGAAPVAAGIDAGVCTAAGGGGNDSGGNGSGSNGSGGADGGCGSGSGGGAEETGNGSGGNGSGENGSGGGDGGGSGSGGVEGGSGKGSGGTGSGGGSGSGGGGADGGSTGLSGGSGGRGSGGSDRGPLGSGSAVPPSTRGAAARMPNTGIGSVPTQPGGNPWDATLFATLVLVLVAGARAVAMNRGSHVR
jgi:hypothetical protein